MQRTPLNFSLKKLEHPLQGRKRAAPVCRRQVGKGEGAVDENVYPGNMHKEGSSGVKKNQSNQIIQEGGNKNRLKKEI